MHERTHGKIAGNGQAVLKRKERAQALRLAAQMIHPLSHSHLLHSNNIIESKHQLLPLVQPLQRVSKLFYNVLPHRIVADHPDRAIRLLAKTTLFSVAVEIVEGVEGGRAVGNELLLNKRDV